MIVDPSASGGDVVGVSRDLFSPPRGAPRTQTQIGRGAGAGIVSVVDRSGVDTTRQISGYCYDARASGGNDAAALPRTVLPRSGGLAWRSLRTTDAEGNNNETGSVVSGAAARLAEAWSLLEASEAARRRLSEEVKGWADRAAGLEEALAAAEATAETRAREARLLAASLQDARDGLALEEAARREAEGRADALRLALSGGVGGDVFDSPVVVVVGVRFWWSRCGWWWWGWCDLWGCCWCSFCCCDAVTANSGVHVNSERSALLLVRPTLKGHAAYCFSVRTQPRRGIAARIIDTSLSAFRLFYLSSCRLALISLYYCSQCKQEHAPGRRRQRRRRVPGRRGRRRRCRQGLGGAGEGLAISG